MRGDRAACSPKLEGTFIGDPYIRQNGAELYSVRGADSLCPPCLRSAMKVFDTRAVTAVSTEEVIDFKVADCPIDCASETSTNLEDVLVPVSTVIGYLRA